VEKKQEVMELDDVVIKLWRHKYYMGVFVFLCCLIVAIYSLVIPELYTSKAKILPVSDSSSKMMMSSGMMNIAAMMGVGGGGQTPAGQLLAIANSRPVVRNVIERCDLMSVLFEKETLLEADEAGRRLLDELAITAIRSGMVMFVDDIKTGTINISSEFQDPLLSKKVIEVYLDEVKNFINNNTLTVAKRNRIYLESQLVQNKKDLLNIGKVLSEFYQGDTIISKGSTIDVLVTKDKQSNLNDEIQVLYSKQNEIDEKIEEFEILEDIPQQVYLQYLSLKRELLFQVNTVLTQQFEMAKIQEGQDELVFQVIDPPNRPEKRSKPRRRQMVMIAFILSTFLAIFMVFLKDYVKKLKIRLDSGKH
jgi:tyrosine-protein kinase Etk/Wzc